MVQVDVLWRGMTLARGALEIKIVPYRVGGFAVL